MKKSCEFFFSVWKCLFGWMCKRHRRTLKTNHLEIVLFKLINQQQKTVSNEMVHLTSGRTAFRPFAPLSTRPERPEGKHNTHQPLLLA
jgi:hypothetical protein